MFPKNEIWSFLSTTVCYIIVAKTHDVRNRMRHLIRPLREIMTEDVKKPFDGGVSN